MIKMISPVNTLSEKYIKSIVVFFACIMFDSYYAHKFSREEDSMCEK